MPLVSERVTFAGGSGAVLAARLDRPAGAVRAFALFAHCFTCSKDIFAASRIAGGLTDRGIAVLRFDFTGLGASEGEFANTNFSSNVTDLVAAADFLRRQHRAPGILIGHSLGGAAVIVAAARVAECRAVATIGAPADPAHVRHLIQPAVAEIEARGEAEVKIAGRPFRIRKQFLADIEGHALAASVGNLKRALLIFHAPRDATVGIENAGLIFQAAKHPKSFVSLDDADHLLSRHADAAYVARVLAAWATRYVDGLAEQPVAEQPVAAPTAPPGTVVVEETRAGKFTQLIRSGAHLLTADEPVDAGGADTGPGPYDLLLAGLGACTSMTLRMYAEHKGWPLDRVTVELKHQKIHASDCAECETREGKIDRIERSITLAGPLDGEQRRRLLEIADKCPVHRTLHSEVQVVTNLAG
jgi:putative redox protein